MSEALDIIARGRDHAEAIAVHLLGAPNKHMSSRRELRWGNRGSFSLSISGAHQGKWTDHETQEHGDTLDMIEREMRLPRNEAIRWLSDFVGGGRATPVDHSKRQEEVRKAEIADDAARKAKRSAARRLWTEGAPILGTLAEAYLVRRLGGKPVPLDAIEAGNLRFHPSPLFGQEHFPGMAGALIARMVDPLSGEGRGIQRIFLTADAAKIERRMLGKAGVVCLYPFEDVTYGLGIGEGIETSLAVVSEMEWRPVWAVLSAGAMRNFPLLPGVESLTVFADADESGTGQSAAAEACQRWADDGREARAFIPPRIGEDFGDIASRRAA